MHATAPDVSLPPGPGMPLPPVPASVVHMLAEAAEAAPASTALTFEGRVLDYAGYLRAVAALARRWRRHAGPGERIALVVQNSLDLAVATFAAHALRAQVVPLNPRYSARELAQMLADADPCLVLHDDSVKVDVAALCAGHTRARVQSVRGGAAFAALAGEGGALPADLPVHDDLATLQYTGGTTGRSKGVNILHRHLAFNLVQREAYLPTRPGAEVMLCSMPLFHVSAVAMCLHLSVYARSHLVIQRRFDAAAMLRAIPEHRVTLVSGAPTVFYSLLAEPVLEDVDLATLRVCYSGAAPLPAEILRRWRERVGAPILEGYGMSEAGPCMTYTPEHGVHKAGSVGLPVPGSHLEIVDTDTGTRVLARGESGEIRVRGPHVMAGYRNLPEQTAATLRDGWLYTGDIARMDEDGYVYIQGRRFDSINVGGFTVYPREVEEVLLTHAEVGEAAAFAAPHPRYGQVVQAWVVPRPGAVPDPERLIAHCRQGLAGYKVPDAIGITDALPKTGVGKLARAALAPVRAHSSPPDSTSHGGGD